MGSSGGGVDEAQYVVAKYDYIAQGNQVSERKTFLNHSKVSIKLFQNYLTPYDIHCGLPFFLNLGIGHETQ